MTEKRPSDKSEDPLSEASALTAAISKLYEENVALDDDNSLRKILDAIPDGAVKENLRSNGIKISYRDFNGRVVPRNRMGSLMFVQLPDEPNDEGLVFPVQGQINAAHMLDWFGTSGKEIISRPVRSKLVGDTIELIDKDAAMAIIRANFNKTSGNISNDNEEVKPPQTKPPPDLESDIPATPTPTEPTAMHSVVESKPIDMDGPIIDFNFDVPPEVVPAVGAEPITRPPEIALAAGVGPVQTKEQIGSVEKVQSLTTEEVKHMLEDQLKNNPDVLNITNVKVDEEDGGLRLNVGITTSGGKAIITGLVVNEGNGLAMSDLDVDANLFIRGRVKNAFADFSSAIKSQLEQRYGKTISNIQIGKSGVAIEFEAPVAGTAPDDKIEPTLRSVPEQQDDRVDFMARQADLLDELNAKYPEGIPQHIHKELLDFGSRYIGNRESGADPAVEAQIRADRESFMASEGVQFAAEDARSPDKPTAGESRSKLRELVGKLVGNTKEKFDWYKSSEERLIRRNEELDTQLEAIGGKLKIERGFRWIGEKYNKLPFKYKLALGAALGLGTVLTAGTLAVALPLLGIATQRAAGLATMYMKFEKQSHDEKWGKNVEWGKQKAMLKAGVYTVLMGLTMKEAIEYASGTELAHAAQAKVEGFLGWMMGHTASSPVATAPEAPIRVVPPTAPEASVASAPDAPVAEPAPPAVPAPQPSVAEAAGEVVAPEISKIEVQATAGKGYEWMAKRLIEDPQIKSISPTYYGLQSDVTRLLYAQQEGNLNKVLHDIATEKGWFNISTGESAQINLNQKISFDKYGVLQISNSETLERPLEGTLMTPPYSTEPVPVRPPPSGGISAFITQETSEIPTSHSEMPTHIDVQFRPSISDGADSDVNAVGDTVVSSEQAPPAETTRSMPISPESPAEAPTPVVEPQAQSVEPSAEPLTNVKVSGPEVYAKVDLIPDQEAVDRAAKTVTTSPSPEAVEHSVVEPPAQIVEQPLPAGEIPVQPTEPNSSAAETVPETQSPAPVIERSIISNQFGLSVPVAESHIYAGADAGHTFAFGGTPTERANAILQYLRENPNKVVFGPDDTNTYRVPWHLVEGKLTPGSPMRTNGLFGFLSTWMRPPGPEDLKSFIK